MKLHICVCVQRLITSQSQACTTILVDIILHQAGQSEAWVTVGEKATFSLFTWALTLSGPTDPRQGLLADAVIASNCALCKYAFMSRITQT